MEYRANVHLVCDFSEFNKFQFDNFNIYNITFNFLNIRPEDLFSNNNVSCQTDCQHDIPVLQALHL